ncbi:MULTISPECIES: hypothetical protein [unclassified Colwellia]|jgi:hypothetical protein|uniref:hypothetical protein n=1 Tax=unclassified Colwellia TaxID=196834 RepID=UPI0015F582AE|nr:MULTISPECIES: hypothetical protein [unclassified Colwellia]MBA6251974.1 hypothetical protein [Colwellia sp. MB3u-55]MBA6396925.1 hypothetical protein [Colwellia sp. BRX10-4]
MSEKVQILSITKSKGVSKKTGNAYEIYKANIAVKAVGFGAEGQAKGVNAKEVDLSADAFIKGFSFDYPNEFVVDAGGLMSNGLQITSISKA